MLLRERPMPWRRRGRIIEEEEEVQVEEGEEVDEE